MRILGINAAIDDSLLEMIYREVTPYRYDYRVSQVGTKGGISTVEAGLTELIELGGWKPYEVVLRYAHLAPEHLADAAARIERDLGNVANGATIELRW